MKQKASANENIRDAPNAAQVADMRNRVIMTIEMAENFNYIDNSMFEQNPSRIYRWFQYFSDGERQDILERVKNFKDENTKLKFRKELEKERGVRTAVGNRNNLYQMCYPFVYMLTCKKAKITKTEAVALLQKLCDMSVYKPITTQVWNSLICTDPVAKSVDSQLSRQKLNIHDHPSIINVTRFLTSSLVLSSGVTELTLINLDVNLEELITLIGKLSTLDVKPSTDINTTTKTEHIIHMMCLTKQGDTKRVRTGYKHCLKDVQVVMGEKQ